MFPTMRLELAERLVCPAAHARTPLIVVADATADRDLLRGTAGCMLCHREARFVAGSLEFAPAAAAGAGVRAAMAGDGAVAHSSASAPDEALLERVVALLGIIEPGMSVLLSARYAALAPVLAERHEALVAVLGAAGPSVHGVGHVRGSGDVVPFSDATFAAAALGDDASAALVADAMRAVRVGGRVLVHATQPLPVGVEELARDARDWLGEVRQAPAPVVPLRRA
jgi:hypothetical protein